MHNCRYPYSQKMHIKKYLGMSGISICNSCGGTEGQLKDFPGDSDGKNFYLQCRGDLGWVDPGKWHIQYSCPWENSTDREPGPWESQSRDHDWRLTQEGQPDSLCIRVYVSVDVDACVCWE